MPEESNDIEYLRGRIHKLADASQRQEITLHEHELQIATIRGTLEALSMTSATSHQLETAVTVLTLKLVHLHADLDLIKRAIYWFSAVVLGSVLLALLSLVLLKP